jgi:hypothetical protein
MKIDAFRLAYRNPGKDQLRLKLLSFRRFRAKPLLLQTRYFNLRYKPVLLVLG